MAGNGKAQYHANVPDTDPRAAMSEQPRFAHEVLAVVLQVRDQQLNVLLWRRGAAPFEGCWALPGGPLGAGERLGTSLGRHLATKVDLTDIAYLEQLETRSDPRVGRPSGLGTQPAAGADPPGRDRGHGRSRPARAGGRQAGHAIPVRGPHPR